MKLKNKRILVTGGAGFIGSHLVDELVKQNEVIVLDNFVQGSMDKLKNAKKDKKLKIVKGDIRVIATVNKLMKDIDVVYHLATQGVRVSINNPFEVHDVNATGSLNLYMSAYKHKVKRFIHISSSEIYGTARAVPMTEDHPLNPETVYGASKLAGEMYGIAYFRTYGFPVTIIRPFNTYGPRSHFSGPYGEVIPRMTVRALNNLPPIVFGDGSQTRDFMYVSDTVHGLLLAGESDDIVGQVTNIALGRERSINEVAKIILKVLDKKELGIKYLDSRPGDVLRLYANNKKAKKILGFEANVHLENGIKMYIDWLLSQNIDLKKALKEVQPRNW